VQLDWADNVEPDLAGYGVELRNGDGSWSPLAAVTSSAFTHTGLVNDVAYSYRVVARDAAGNVSPPSATVTATPVAQATYSPGSYSVVTGSLVGGSLASLAADDGSRLAVDARKLSRRNFRAELTASVTLPADRVASLRSLAIAYDGHVSTSGASLRIRVLNRRTGLWETVDGPRTGVTSDRPVSWAAAVPADYVSATGQVRVSAYAESTSDFVQRTDLVSVTIAF
jgi:chitodextrinase